MVPAPAQDEEVTLAGLAVTRVETLDSAAIRELATQHQEDTVVPPAPTRTVQEQQVDVVATQELATLQEATAPATLAAIHMDRATPALILTDQETLAQATTTTLAARRATPLPAS
jgi:hypothetical protein